MLGSRTWEEALPLIVLFPSFAFAVPHVSELGGGINILTDNDLHGNTTTRTGGAILLDTAVLHDNATRKCEALSERLWSPAPGEFASGLNNSLSYQSYLNRETEEHGGLYWVESSKNASSCSAISNNGTVHEISCDKELPALCTQSAPMSIPARANTSSTYQISQHVGKQTLTGFRDFHTFRFHGVRFAPEPKRFEFSTLYEGEDNVSALEYGHDCVQGFMGYLGTMNEDCLFMNIWTPYLPSSPSDATTKKKLKPVLFWIYGGGNTEGSGTDPEKEGGQLASRGDVVVVEFSYRLGALGWLPFNDGIHNGNYGASDMLNALRWTKKYISALGGDPDRITIFGESAGATGVRLLLTSPLADGLMSGAIMQSVPGGATDFGGWSNWTSPSRWYNQISKVVLAENGCANVTDEIACMRASDPHKWAESGKTHSHLPTRDGTIIPYSGLPISGPLATPRDIKLAIGTARDEAAIPLMLGLPLNFTEQMKAVDSLLGTDLVSLSGSPLFNPELEPGWASLSDAQKAGQLFNATQHVATEVAFKCITIATAYSASKNRAFASVYQFQHNRTYIPAMDFPLEQQRICGRNVSDPDVDEYYKCHAGDNPVVFGNAGFLGWPDRGGSDILYSRLIVDYWSSFARTGKMQPDAEYLKARGFWSSAQHLREVGVWEELDVNAGPGQVMSLQWTGQSMFAWSDAELERCKMLGYPQDYYESVDYKS